MRTFSSLYGESATNRCRPSPSQCTTSWTDERFDQAKALWHEGLSAAQIARKLGGVTRNAVIGKLHRAGLKRSMPNLSRRSNSRPKAQPSPKVVKMVKPLRAPVMKAVSNHAKNPLGVKAQMTPAALRLAGNGMVFEESSARPACSPAKPSAWLPLPGSEPVPIMGLRSGRCKWPVDVPGMAESCFCNLTAIGDRYCTTHAVMSAAPEQPKMRDLVRSVRRIAA